MTKRFTEQDYIVGVWFVPGNQKDWFCMIWKEGEGFAGYYRFRYYDPGTALLGPHEAHDKKSWYALSFTHGTEAEIEQKISIIATEMARIWGAQMDFVPVHGGGPDLAEIIQTRSWAHGRVLKELP